VGQNETVHCLAFGQRLVHFGTQIAALRYNLNHPATNKFNARLKRMTKVIFSGTDEGGIGSSVHSVAAKNLAD
jgi:hypothetical protein